MKRKFVVDSTSTTPSPISQIIPSKPSKTTQTYLQITLQFDPPLILQPLFFQDSIKRALLQSFGTHSKEMIYTVGKCKDGKAVVRVGEADARKLWCALSMCGRYQGKVCRYLVRVVDSALFEACE